MRLLRERGLQQAQAEHERCDFRCRRHECGHRRRCAFVHVGCPHVERRGGRLEADAGDDHREADHEQRVAGEALLPDGMCDLLEADASRRSVDERRAEEQARRSERAHDQILQACLERALAVVVDRAQDVEGDREPLEREKERHQVRGADEEGHAGDAGEQQREVLGDVVVTPVERCAASPRRDVLRREKHGAKADAAEDRLRERRPTVAIEGVSDDPVAVRAVDVQPDRGDEPTDAAEPGDRCRERTSVRPGDQYRGEQRDPGRAEEREDRREREPVDVRRMDHLNCTRIVSDGWSPANEWCEMLAGHTERASSTPTSGTSRASSPGRRSSASSRTVEPRDWCSTAEMSRSMYIAPSTIATAPITAHHHARWYAPARIRNSPANAAEPGTASEMTPTVMSSVASAGRPRAMPPSSANSPVVVRRSTTPAMRKSEVEMNPCATICSTAPS